MSWSYSSPKVMDRQLSLQQYTKKSHWESSCKLLLPHFNVLPQLPSVRALIGDFKTGFGSSVGLFGLEL